MKNFRHPMRLLLGLLFVLSMLVFFYSFLLKTVETKKKISKEQETTYIPIQIEKEKQYKDENVTSLSLSQEEQSFDSLWYYVDFIPSNIITYLGQNRGEIDCSPIIMVQQKYGSPDKFLVQEDKIYSAENTTYYLEPTAVPSFILDLNQKNKESQSPQLVDTFRVCESGVEYNRETTDPENQPVEFIQYHVSKGGGGGARDTHFAKIQNGVLLSEMKIENNGPYSGCSEILAMTEKNELFILCVGGDGGYSERSLHKVDFNNDTVTTLKSCEYQETDSGESEEDCK